MAPAGMAFHTCRCGQTRCAVDVPGSWAGTRLICYCKDCQTAARLHADGADMLSAAGGSDIWQTTPDMIEIDRGVENLKVIRLSPKGLLRWHAGCCGTPMFNTLPNVKLPFVGIVLRQSELQDVAPVFGKVRCHASTESAVPGRGAPKKDKAFARAGFLVLQRMFSTWLSGRAKDNPLRQNDGTPIAQIEVITKAQRKSALPPHLSNAR